MSIVNVTKNAAGTWWRMEYGGHVDYLETEPSEAERAQFVRSVTAMKARTRAEAALPPMPAQRKTEADYR